MIAVATGSTPGRRAGPFCGKGQIVKTVVAAAIGLCAVLWGESAHTENLLVNGDFSRGRGQRADGWQTEQWDTKPGTTEFLYRSPQGDEPGMVGIINRRANDARWVQDVSVSAERWYHLSVKVKVKDVGPKGMGATLSFSSGDHYQSSNDVKKSGGGWRPLELWTRTDKWQTRLKVALRLGGYGNINTGEAWFSDARVEEVEKPPPGAPNVFEPPPRKSGRGPWSLWALIVVLGLVTIALWRYLGNENATGASREEGLLLAGLLLVTLAAKIAVAPYFGFYGDVGTYKAWAYDLASKGPDNFYRPGYFADYPPGYMYILWLVGSVLQEMGTSGGEALATTAIKLPALLTDLFAAWLLFALLRPRAGRGATWAVVLAYALNPALIFNSAIWGQTDSVFTLILLLGVCLLAQGSLALASALLTLAALTKPQTLVFLPLLAAWPGTWRWPEKLPGAAIAAVVVAASLVFPVGGSDPFRWVLGLYAQQAASYPETSANAFNLMAILGGLRQPDARLLLGISFRKWGIALFGGYFLFALYLLWRRRGRTMLFYLCFLTPFALFLLMTRMHERYLYPSFAFLALLLPARRRLWVIFAGLSLTYSVNLAYVYTALQANRFLPVHDPVAMACAGLNILFFVLAAFEGVALARAYPAEDLVLGPAEGPRPGPRAGVVGERGEGTRDKAPAWDFERGAAKFSLARLDIALIVALTLIGGALRFYHLREPAELVFDEVYFVEQGRNYLRGREFMDPHPPAAKLAIAGSILLFGNDSGGWRMMNALTGTLLVGITYLLGRKLFGSRAGSVSAAGAVALDGLFLVDSRTAVIDIYYVTFGALACLFLFCFLRSQSRRPVWLVGTGVFVGLSLAAKLYIPAFTWLVVVAALTGGEWVGRRSRRSLAKALTPACLVTASGAAVYLACYLPHYYLGWWHGIGDIFVYFKGVVGYERAVSDATHPYSSKWWTWPLLLRPVWYYFKDAPGDASRIVGVWAGGNPLLWWAGTLAIPIVATRAWRKEAAAAFIVAGFVLHLVPWIPIGRVLFQYHYFPSLFFSFLALGLVLGALWDKDGAAADSLAGRIMLLPLAPVLGFWLGMAGIAAFGLLAVAYMQAARMGLSAERGLVAIYALVALGLAVYFYPLWAAIPLARSGYSARMWFQGPGLPNWI